MKVCPVCDKTYKDEFLNFCLDDGAGLTELKTDEPPPTVILDKARNTNPNFDTQYQEPKKPSFDDYNQPQFGAPNQQVYQQPFSFPQPNFTAAYQDQNLAIVALVLGIASIVLSLCCYAGLPIGIPALIVGYMAMKKADQDPQKYGGRGFAVGGMITGGIGLLISAGMLLLIIIGGALG